VKYPHWLWFDLPLPQVVTELGSPAWARVADAVQNDKSVPIGHEWLLDARAFHLAHNYNMALSAAAIACEVYGYELLRRRLSEGDRVSKKGVTKFLEGVSRRDLFPTLFRYFEIADAATAEKIATVLSERNMILHGKQKRQVSEDRAAAALRMAEFLESAVSQ
jgi:hypothetical protein